MTGPVLGDVGQAVPVRSRMSSLDLATRLFWRLRGRRVDLAHAERWLDAPMSDGETVARELAAVGEQIDDVARP